MLQRDGDKISIDHRLYKGINGVCCQAAVAGINIPVPGHYYQVTETYFGHRYLKPVK